MSRRTSTEPTLVRQWRVLRDLAAARGAGWHVAELARRHGVSKATIQRDLDTLSRVFQVESRPASTHRHTRLWRAAAPAEVGLRQGEEREA